MLWRPAGVPERAAGVTGVTLQRATATARCDQTPPSGHTLPLPTATAPPPGLHIMIWPPCGCGCGCGLLPIPSLVASTRPFVVVEPRLAAASCCAVWQPLAASVACRCLSGVQCCDRMAQGRHDDHSRRQRQSADQTSPSALRRADGLEVNRHTHPCSTTLARIHGPASGLMGCLGGSAPMVRSCHPGYARAHQIPEAQPEGLGRPALGSAMTRESRVTICSALLQLLAQLSPQLHSLPRGGCPPPWGRSRSMMNPGFCAFHSAALTTCPTAQAPSAVGQQLCRQQAARLLHVCMRAHAHACLHMVYYVPHRARNVWSQQPTTLPLPLHPCAQSLSPASGT